MTNKRIFYAVYQAGFAKDGFNVFTSAHGLTTCSLETKYNLNSYFEIGQLEVYQQREGQPDVTATIEKQLDGYCPVYLLATNPSTSPSLAGRSVAKTILGLSLYGDTQNSASGTPFAQVTCSGLFVQQLTYTIPVQGASTESVTLIGNNKIWTNTFTATAFTNTDQPLAISGSGGVQERQDILFGSSASLLPGDIPGVTASGTLELGADGNYGACLQSIKVSANLGRTALFELGKRGVYFRYVEFPVQVTSDFEILTTQGDLTSAVEDSQTNLTDRTIKIKMREGLVLDLGTKNKLTSSNMAGANAQQNGGNMTSTFSYLNNNSLAVTHPQDPSGL